MRLDTRICDRARLARDPRFDGLFFTGVLSTGIYCRPICPARPPKPENIVYFLPRLQRLRPGCVLVSDVGPRQHRAVRPGMVHPPRFPGP